jgi:ribosomal protein L9
MKIILLDKIQRLGEIGDIVEVNSGYARNFLIPQKKAAFASDKNIAEVEARKDELAAASADMLTKAEARAETINEPRNRGGRTEIRKEIGERLERLWTQRPRRITALEKDYEEVGIETAEGEGEEEGYGDEF